jgi:MFS family permease
MRSGAGAGIFGALTPLVVVDIMRGTGRYNLALGAIGTMVGIGASLSGLGAGVIVDHFGDSATFLNPRRRRPRCRDRLRAWDARNCRTVDGIAAVLSPLLPGYPDDD